MNSNPMIQTCLTRLDSIVLRPRMTLSLSSYNRQTGTHSEQQCISFSAGFTLLRGMMMLAGGTAIAFAAMRCLRHKEKQKFHRAMKKHACKMKKVTKP